MNVQDYKQAGFALSQQIEQPVIDRAEADIIQAYVVPVTGNTATTDADVRDAVSNLAYLLVLQRSIAGTRAGAKTKQTAQSTDASRLDLLSQQAAVCAQKVQVYAERVGVHKPWRVCSDICGIYYKTQVLGY